MEPLKFIADEVYLDYTIKKKIDGQTVKLYFESSFNRTYSQCYWNVVLSIYNKRTQEDKNHSECKTTGKSLKGLLFAKKAITEFESFIQNEIPCKHTICIQWTNGRRRDVYTRSLVRMGYKIGQLTIDKCGKKYIYKIL